MALFSAALRKSLADITRRKGRFLLVIAGILIGVFGLTTIDTAEGNLVSSFAFASGYNSQQPDIVLNVDRLDPALIPTLQAIPNVSAVQYQSIYHTLWDTHSAAGQVPLAIQSYPDLAHVPLHPFQLTQGRYPNVGEILLDFDDQQNHGFHIGGTVEVETGQGTTQLRVVGITSTAGFTPQNGGDAIGYMSEAGLQQLAGTDVGIAITPNKRLPIPSLVNTVNVKAQQSGANQLSATKIAMQQMLTVHQVQVFNTFQPGANANLPLIEKTIGGLFWLLRILVILAVVMSGFLILGTVTTLIAEQTTIIGVMKVMGGTHGAILRGYLLTVAIACAPATIIGVALGHAAGYALAGTLAQHVPMPLLPFAPNPEVIALGLAVGFGVPLLAAIIPIWNGLRITVRDALASFGVQAGTGTSRLARVGQRLTWVSQTTWLGMRGTFRKRWRAALTITSLVVAGICFLVVQIAVTSVNDTVTDSTATSSADLTVRFADPAIYSHVSAQLAALPNVKRIEPYASGNATTSWGTLSVDGYEPNTQIYHYQLTGGRWLRAGDTNVILLGDDAARRTGLHIGDTIVVDGTRSLTIIGTIHQTISVLGWIGAAIIPINTLNALSTSSTIGTQEIVIEATDRSLSAVNQLAARVNAIVNPDGAGRSDDPGYFSGNGGTIDTVHEYTTRRQGTWYILYYLLYGVVLVVGVAGALGLANALISSVADRRREIGILRALGARSGQVARVFWVEGVSLGILAWLIGAAVGVLPAYAFVQLIWQAVMPLDFHVDPLAFVVMLVAILGIASLANMAPAWRAAHSRTAEMLRYE